MPNKYPWIVLDNSAEPTVFRCKRCNKTLEAPWDVTIDTYLFYSKAFIFQHKKCKLLSDKGSEPAVKLP